MRIAVLCSRRETATNAIEDASFELVRAFREFGADPELALRRPDGSWTTADGTPLDMDDVASRADALVLQYQPFLWGRRGIAPWLPLLVTRLRRRHSFRMALVVHEPFLDLGGPVQTILSVWQRMQLGALRGSADVVCVSIERWAGMLAAARPRRPTVYLPVGSNMPDRSDDRDTARAELGVTSDDFVVVVFGTNHPTRLWSYADAALVQVAALRHTVLLSLGGGNPFPSSPPSGVTVHRPGVLPAEDVSRLLAAADLMLAPFSDGVSTRRGSVMAGLQHSVALLGTDGHLTDETLRQAAAPLLTPVGDVDAFAAAAGHLAGDDDERAELARAGRALYESEFAWPRIAARLLSLLESTPLTLDA